MSDERKIAIKAHLDDRVKGVAFAGKTFYPLYIRVTYLNKGTMIKVLDKEDNTVYVDAESYEKLRENQGLNEKLDTPGRILLMKSMLLAQAIKIEHDLKKDRFNFKIFTKKFKIWEKALFHVLYQNFIDLAHQKALKEITDLYEFNKLNFSWILRNENQSDKLFKTIIIDDELRASAESLIAYYLYQKLILKKVVDHGYRALETCTVLHWLDGSDRREFIQSKVEAMKNNIDPAGFFSSSFMQSFQPNIEKYFDYQEYIDGVIKSLK